MGTHGNTGSFPASQDTGIRFLSVGLSGDFLSKSLQILVSVSYEKPSSGILFVVVGPIEIKGENLMSIFIEGPVVIEKKKNGTGLDYAWCIITEGKIHKGLMVFINHMNSGQGWGCKVYHGATPESLIPWDGAFRVSKYKYLRGCPAKYLPLVKHLEKALRS